MAKGNMLLGYARGKVGDVVFYREDGEQMARARNRRPKNPRTVAQQYQRAIMATVMMAYSQGKEIFDHSFQDRRVGMECMREFLSVNTRELRASISNAINNGAANTGAKVIAPKSNYMVPFTGMVISRGTYDQNLFEFNGSDEYSLNEAYLNQTVQSLLDNGIIRDRDLFTFIIISGNPEKSVFSLPGIDSKESKQYATGFGFVRLQVNVQQDALNQTLIGVAPNKIFEVTDVRNATAPKLDTAGSFIMNASNMVSGGPSDESVLFASGLIRSRVDMDLRSNSSLTCYNPTTFGISPQYILDAWMREVDSLGGSELILEGGNF